MAALMRLSERTAVVTGAASGIGRAVSVALARRKCHLALADIDDKGLIKTAELVAKEGVLYLGCILENTLGNNPSRLILIQIRG